MIALVDYDNLRVRPGRLRYAMTRLLDAIGARQFAEDARLRCRLYGGWFDQFRLSKRAQRIIHEMSDTFPRRMTAPNGEGSASVLVHMELARALVGDRIDLTHTYRRRSVPPNLSCAPAPFDGCASPSRCPIAALTQFVEEAGCPTPNCDVTPDAVLRRDEQKLVDSMLVADLIRLAQTTSERLVVVSSDDDMWPGIRVALLHGARVLHVRSRQGPPSSYQPLTTRTYSRTTVAW